MQYARMQYARMQYARMQYARMQYVVDKYCMTNDEIKIMKRELHKHNKENPHVAKCYPHSQASLHYPENEANKMCFTVKIFHV